MASELDNDYIKSKIQEVLKIAHTDQRKWKIKDFPDRLQFSCPICGDSLRSPGQKLRGVLYKKNMHFVCFNESGCSRSFLKLLKTFNIDIDLQKKVDIYNYLDSNIHYSKNDDTFIAQKLDKLIDIDQLVDFMNNNQKSQFSNFGPIKKNSAIYQYLKFDRQITNFENIYEANYHVTSKWTEKVIVMLNRSGKKVLGMQIRNIKPGDKRMFKIFNFEKLYNLLNPNDTLDEIESISYNKLSNFFNILNVDWDKPVTLFEGYLDSIFMKNSLAGIGINSTVDNFLLSDDIDLRFFYDQDYIGVKTALEMLEKGHTVFLWQKLIDDLLKNKKDKHSAKKYLLSIKDLNKLVQEINNIEKFNKINFEKYFSNDIFDKIYLDYTLYPKNKKNNYEKNLYSKSV